MSYSRDVKQAVFGLLTAMLVVDGKVDDDELTRLIGHAVKHPLFAGMTDDEVTALARGGVAEVKKHGAFEMLARWAVSVPAELTETTFELLIQAMLADGVYHKREGDLGDALREALKIPKPRAIEIADRVVKAHHAERGS